MSTIALRDVVWGYRDESTLVVPWGGRGDALSFASRFSRDINNSGGKLRLVCAKKYESYYRRGDNCREYYGELRLRFRSCGWVRPPLNLRYRLPSFVVISTWSIICTADDVKAKWAELHCILFSFHFNLPTRKLTRSFSYSVRIPIVQWWTRIVIIARYFAFESKFSILIIRTFYRFLYFDVCANELLCYY